MAAPIEEIDEFGIARKRAKQQEQANLQQKQQALKRRFAVLGTGASGARIKAEERAQTEFGQNIASAEEQIGAAERAEARRKREIQEAREFQTSERIGSQEFSRGERLGSQEFAGAEANLQREFLDAQRLGGEEFAAEQADLQRKFVTGERIGAESFARAEASLARVAAREETRVQRLFEAGQNEEARKLQKQIARNALNLETLKFQEASRQFNETFKEEVRINDKNIEFSERMLAAQEAGGFFDQLFGGDGLSSPEGFADNLFGSATGGLIGAAAKRAGIAPSDLIKRWGIG